MPILFSLLTFSFIFLTQTALAAPEYSVSPLVIDLELEARDIIKREITITNTGHSPVTVYPSINNISLDDGGVIEEFLSPVETDRTSSLSSWVAFSRLGINLKSGESHTLELTFKVNPNPVPDTYHAFVGFGHGRNRPEAEKMITNGKAPGTIITVQIEEKINQFLKLSKFIVDRFVIDKNNTAAVYTFNNPSDETLTPTGEIIFYDSKGQEVGAVKVNEQNQKIQPGKEHVFETKVPVEGLFGKYKAFLTVEYGSGQKAQIQDTSFFYVFPLKNIIISLSGLLLAVILLAWFLHRKYLDEDESLDHEYIAMHVRDGKSDPREHDIDLKRNDKDT